MTTGRRPRIGFVCDQEIKEFLEEWADEEGRTVSNLIERIVEAAVAAKKETEDPSPKATRRLK